MTKLIRNIRNNQKGFTLIELMIVVAIIGILAAIAIPNFLNYQLKSKTAEAKTNIGAIRTSQEAYKAEHDQFIDCAVQGGGGTSKGTWPATAAGFDDIGFEPSGPVYYLYEVDPGGTGNIEMCISAVANLDGDSSNGEFGFATEIGDVATTGSMNASCTANGQVQDLAPGVY
jgi:type IV pilus assembly protein PilA